MLARLAPLCAVALALAGCGVSLPFGLGATPTPAPTRAPVPTATPTPAPTPTPRPAVEVRQIQVTVVDKTALSVAVAFLLRNPNTAEFLLAGIASGTFTTPDGRAIPQARPTTIIDLAPGEEKWFSFPSVDTFGSLVGKVEVSIAGGQWLPASSYPYPGGVPTSVARGKEANSFVVKNDGDLGVNASLRGFAFDAAEKFVGIVECPQRLFPARLEVTITCGAAIPDTLKAAKLVFATYADLRPVLVIPTPTPSPTGSPRGTAPAPTPTGR